MLATRRSPSPRLGEFQLIYKELFGSPPASTDAADKKDADATTLSDVLLRSPGGSRDGTPRAASVMRIASILSPPDSPPTPTSQVLVPKDSFLSGLDLASMGLTNSLESLRTLAPAPKLFASEDDDDESDKSGSPTAESYSTPDSSPPSICDERTGMTADKVAAKVAAAAQAMSTTTAAAFLSTTNFVPQKFLACKAPGYVGLPILNEDRRVVGTIPIRPDVPVNLLRDSMFWRFDRVQRDPFELHPFYVCKKRDKVSLLETKLYPQFQLDRMAIASCGDGAGQPIHVFVDLSNIIIGFYDRLKLNRGLPVHRKVKAPAFFFEGFARLLERGRPTRRKVVAGSTMDNFDRTKWPPYMREAEACGYEMNILNRVAKAKTWAERRRTRGKRSKKNANGGWATTSDANSSDDLKQGEQAVDEILHLKMCHSVLDHEPSTIVLATGDAAKAEFSDGFLKHVDRALGRGWCVELWSWSKAISSSWRELAQNQKWHKHRFRIIELDDFAEELFGEFTED